MNRPGQPPQRPPNLTASQGMPGAFRTPYPATYGLPPRNPMQQPGYPSLPTNHRTAGQSMVVPSPGYMQQRTQAAFPFNTTLQHHQVQQAQQHQQQQQLQHTQPQQPTSAASSNLPPHLTQNTAPSLGNTTSVSSTSEAALDPNDFPALGTSLPNSSANPNSTNSSAATNLTSTYASQAGTGLINQGGSSGAQGIGTTAPTSQSRELTAEDFPALGGQGQSTQPSAEASHPPGLNGFMQDDHQGQHRSSVLSSLQAGLHSQQSQPQTQQQQQQQPGMLNLGTQRSIHQAFQSETDKRLGIFQSNVQNGVPTHGHQQSHLQQQPHLNAPPGVPPPSTFQQPQPLGPSHQQQSQQFGGNGTIPSDAPHPTHTPANAQNAIPQSAAQQVLISPADRWGLLGLLAMIKSGDPDQALLSVGTDLGTMGLDMQQSDLSSTFMTPWTDSSAAHLIEPDFHLPACYNVHPPPPGPTKAVAFSDETLFFMFYSSPRDALQEVAAQELYNRNWRYHKELRVWLTKEAGTRLSQKIEGGEQGLYTYWDPEGWDKQRKELTVLYSDLEERSGPVFTGPTVQQGTQQQTQQALQQAQLQTQAVPRNNFQGILA